MLSSGLLHAMVMGLDIEVMRTKAVLFHDAGHHYGGLREHRGDTRVFQTAYIFNYITYIYMVIYKSLEISVLV